MLVVVMVAMMKGVKVSKYNVLICEFLKEKGNGRVLVDCGGSLRCSILGGNSVHLAQNNGWLGIVVNGCITSYEGQRVSNRGKLFIDYDGWTSNQ